MARYGLAHLELYNQDVLVCWDEPSFRAIARRLKFKGVDAEYDASRGGYVKQLIPLDAGRAAMLVHINLAVHETRADLVNTIAHEATHVAIGVLDHAMALGDLGHRGPHEVLAYIVGWAAEVIHDSLPASWLDLPPAHHPQRRLVGRS